MKDATNSNKAPVVVCVDMYRQLSDTDHLDLLCVLNHDSFNVVGIVIDCHRQTVGVEYEGVEYVKSFLKLAGFPKIPVVAGMKNPIESINDPVESEGVDLLIEMIKSNPGLIVFCWASMSDMILAWSRLDQKYRKNLRSVYGVLGWFDQRVHPSANDSKMNTLTSSTRLQDDNNVIYDRIAFMESFNNDLPFVWAPVGHVGWLYHEAQEFVRSMKHPVAQWLSRELYHFHLQRELILKEKGGMEYFYGTHRDHLIGKEDPPEGAPINSIRQALKNVDKDDLWTRPIRMWETPVIYHAAKNVEGKPCPGISENTYTISLSWKDNWPYLNSYEKSNKGTPILTSPKPDILKNFVEECLHGYAK